MGFFFNLILLAIFVYVVYRVIASRNIQNKDPYKKDDTDTTHDSVHEEKSVQKKIDMSDVEDADFKEIK